VAQKNRENLLLEVDEFGGPAANFNPGVFAELWPRLPRSASRTRECPAHRVLGREVLRLDQMLDANADDSSSNADC